eukprot:267113-Ditylum_brightwellii.AAC.1
MHRYKVDMFAFVETNIAWTPQAKHTAKRITEKVYKKNYKIETSSSDEISVNHYQSGGSMIGVVGKHQGQILDVQQDKSGLERWSHVSMTGKDKKITIVSAYCVAQNKNGGIHTAYI